MKEIPHTFAKLGWSFNQIARKGAVAIFARWKDPAKPHMEVVRIRQHNGFPLPDGTRTEPGESYPPDNQWGKDGFTFAGDGMAERAELKMRALLES